MKKIIIKMQNRFLKHKTLKIMTNSNPALKNITILWSKKIMNHYHFLKQFMKIIHRLSNFQFNNKINKIQ